MTTQSDHHLKEDVSGYMKKSWKWLMLIGVFTFILGVIGTGMSVTMTIVSIIYIAVLVFFGGIAHLFDAFIIEGWKNKLLAALVGLLYLIAAVLMFKYPAASAAWFTLFIACFFVVVGVFRLGIGFQLRNEVKGWFWTAISGVGAIILGILIYAQWPISGLWVIGLFVSIELIMQGIATITVAFAVKDLRKEI